MKTAYRYILAAIFAFSAVTSCIRENVDDCETPVELNFLYFGNGIVDIFPERIDSVLMYIYELPSNSLQNTVRLSKDDLLKKQGAKLRLVPGDYRIVCWGNAGDGSVIDTDNFILTDREHAESGTSDGIEELYFGDVFLTVPLTLRPVEETVVYESSYIMMRVELLGFGNVGNISVNPVNGTTDAGLLSDASEPAVILAHENHSAHIDFDNNPSDDVKTDYVPELAAHPDEEDSYIAEYLVPKFDNETDADLSVYRNDTGELFYSRPMSELMDELGIVIDDRNEQMVNLKLSVSVSGGQVIVEVLGWNSEIVYPEL